jgi:plastocyanin
MNKRMVPLAVALCIAGAACSSKKASTTESPTPAKSSAAAAPVQLSGTVNNHGLKDLSGSGASPSLELEQDNFYFNPTFIKATPGAKVKLEVKNEGTVQHTFTITSLGVDQVVDPGKTQDVEITLPSSGATNFFCRFHVGQGMQGAFYFKDGDTVVTAAASPAAAAPAASPSAMATVSKSATNKSTSSGTSGSGSGSGGGSGY